MIYPEADKLEKWGSKYALVVLAAKRAKQLKSGAPTMIDTDSRNALTVALEEVASGKIKCEVPDHDIVLVTTQEPEVAQLLAIPERMEDEAEADAVAAPVAAVDDEAILDLDEEEIEEEEEVEEDLVSWVKDEVEEEVLAFADDEEEVVVDADEDLTTIPAEEPKPKGRGRKKAVVVPDLDIDIDVDKDDAILDIDDIEEEEE